MGAFFASGAFIGLGAAMEILGVWGYMRADWNPKYGLTLFALVFLARLNALAVIPLTGFFAVSDHRRSHGLQERRPAQRLHASARRPHPAVHDPLPS